MPKPLQDLFQYMNDGTVAEGNEMIQKIDDSVRSWNTGGRIKIVMTLEEKILIESNKARAEGDEKRCRIAVQKMHGKGYSDEEIADNLDITLQDVTKHLTALSDTNNA